MAGGGINFSPLFPATCASEMTLLAQDGPTFPKGIEARLACNLSRKSGIATFSTGSARSVLSGRFFAGLPPGTAVPKGPDFHAGIGTVAEIGGDVASGALGVVAEKVGAGTAEPFLRGDVGTHGDHLKYIISALPI